MSDTVSSASRTSVSHSRRNSWLPTTSFASDEEFLNHQQRALVTRIIIINALMYSQLGADVVLVYFWITERQIIWSCILMTSIVLPSIFGAVFGFVDGAYFWERLLMFFHLYWLYMPFTIPAYKIDIDEKYTIVYNVALLSSTMSLLIKLYIVIGLLVLNTYMSFFNASNYPQHSLLIYVSLFISLCLTVAILISRGLTVMHTAAFEQNFEAVGSDSSLADIDITSQTRKYDLLAPSEYAFPMSLCLAFDVIHRVISLTIVIYSLQFFLFHPVVTVLVPIVLVAGWILFSALNAETGLLLSVLVAWIEWVIPTITQEVYFNPEYNVEGTGTRTHLFRSRFIAKIRAFFSISISVGVYINEFHWNLNNRDIRTMNIGILFIAGLCFTCAVLAWISFVQVEKDNDYLSIAERMPVSQYYLQKLSESDTKAARILISDFFIQEAPLNPLLEMLKRMKDRKTWEDVVFFGLQVVCVCDKGYADADVTLDICRPIVLNIVDKLEWRLRDERHIDEDESERFEEWFRDAFDIDLETWRKKFLEDKYDI